MKSRIIFGLTILLSVAFLTQTSFGLSLPDVVKIISKKLAGASIAITIAGNSVAGTLTTVPDQGWNPQFDTSMPCILSSAVSNSANPKGDTANATAEATTAIWPICTNSDHCQLGVSASGGGEAYAVGKHGFVTEFKVTPKSTNKILNDADELTPIIVEFNQLDFTVYGSVIYHRRISTLPFTSFSSDMPVPLAQLIFEPAGFTAANPSSIHAEITLSFDSNDGILHVACSGFDPCISDSNFLVNQRGFTYIGPPSLTVMVPPTVELADEDYTHFTGKRSDVATGPIPVPGIIGLSTPPQLRWTAGTWATEHALYFGTDSNSVRDATTGNPLGCFKGYVADPVFKLSNLDFNLVADTNYYWRIDEVNDTNVWKGEVWQVLNTNYFVVEDFESYIGNATMRAMWKMGSVDYTSCPYTNSNGVIDLDFNDGQGRMQFDYDNSINEHFSEVRFDANDGNASGSDWTGGGALPDNDKARALALSYIGGPYNDADGDYDRMYAAIEDTAGNFGMVLNPNPQAQRTSVWDQWYINLADLNSTNNVKLANIRYLYLGFGGRCLGNFFGGTGRVWFDDIRLYQKTCLAQYGPVGDLTSDCKVDITDLDTMANAWLAKQTIISPVTNPGTTGLRIWYKFDATTGTTVTDSSGNGFDGEVNSAPMFVNVDPSLTTGLWDSTGGYDGSGCFVSSYWAIRDFNMSIEADANALDANGTSLTLSIWVNGDVYMPLSGWARIICAFQDINTALDDDNEVLEIQCPVPRAGTSSTARFRIGVLGESNEVSSAGMPMSAFAGSWQHYAFVRDGDASKLRIYHNGEMIADANALSTLFRHNVPFESFRLIRRNQGSESWYGKIDDFRVYNRALSQAEVGWLGTKGTGTVPFSNASNLKSSTPEKISFNDMAMLAKNWLVEQRWPNP